jgi:DNA helicase-2/ATP-dependent DNA helicase PcrA
MNRVILAVAGGRKTQHIVDRCSTSDNRRRLVITFATTGQDVLNSRLRAACAPDQVPEVTGWFAFLLNHICRPYLPDLYPGKSITGLNYVIAGDPTHFKRGVDRYVDPQGLVYSHRAAKLAFDILLASKGAVIDRLERIFDEIYIDEVQDLAGNDLELLEALLRSSIDIILVGDVRQSIFDTSRADTKYAKYKRLNKVDWFRLMESRGYCQVEYRNETWRCNQAIIDFADTVIPDRLGLPDSQSHQQIVTNHDGLFVIGWDHISQYMERYTPYVLRDKITSKILDGSNATNFGQAKGATVDRVLIYPTKPMEQFLESGQPLKDESASRLYVAATRAKHSVAFVVQDPTRHKLRHWTP